MRRFSNSQVKGNEKKGKKPVTSQEKAQFFINKLMDSIAGQIEKGKIEINSKKQEIKYLKNQKNMIEQKGQLSMQFIEQNLKQLRSSILQQKREQQSFDKIKLKQAKELVAKMKRQKEQHKLKMIQNETKRTLHSRIFSQSTITRMKQKLEERVIIKKREIEQRINNIILRKNERNKQLGQQIQYLQKVKEINIKAKSNIKLPSLFNPQTNQQIQSKLYIPRKNSLDYLKLNLAKTPKLNKIGPKQIKICNSEAIQNSNNLSQQKYQKNIDTIIDNHILLTNIPESNYKKNEQKQNSSSFLGNKSKIYGDQYLKESILKIKKSNISLKIQTQGVPIQDSLQLQAQEVILNKNENLQKLEQQWKRVLSRIQHNEINQQQGIDLLNSMEKRLDKIDREGMRNRLKKKCEVFDRIQFEIESKSFGIVSGSNTN